MHELLPNNDVTAAASKPAARLKNATQVDESPRTTKLHHRTGDEILASRQLRAPRRILRQLSTTCILLRSFGRSASAERHNGLFGSYA
jgi:hypothetical protein